MHAIDVINMSFGYQGRAEIFDDVSFTVAEGEFVSIIGPNGGGKTTLVKLFLGLLEPTAGEIEIFGMLPRQASGKIGYLAQDPGVDVSFPATVMDIVRMGRVDSTGFLGMGGANSKHSAAHALDAVGMGEFRSTPFASLSGGQRQRVLIARALAAQAKMLLLDEPTSSLDVRVGRDFYNLMHELNDKGMTILVVSHDKEFVSEYVKKVICVHRKVAVHPTAQWDVAMETDLYGGPMRRVMHDHDCLSKGCSEGEHG